MKNTNKCLVTLLTLTFVFAGAFVLLNTPKVSATAFPLSSVLQNYGNEGYVVVGDTFSTPLSLIFNAWGYNQHTWAESTTDVRALQRANVDGRVAAAWYAASDYGIELDLNFIDGREHYVSLYFLDYDSFERVQQVQFLSQGGEVLSSITVSDFNQGVYQTWRVSGHVRAVITHVAGGAPVMSGIFFDSTLPAPPSPTPTPTATPTPLPSPTATPTPVPSPSPTPCRLLPNGKCKKN